MMGANSSSEEEEQAHMSSGSGSANTEYLLVQPKIVRKDDPSYSLWDFTTNIADVSLKMDDGKSFSCHRNILTLGSSYFEAMFNSHMTECKNDEISISGVQSHIMTFVVDFIYKKPLDIPSDDVFDLLSAADLFQLSSLSKAVVSKLVKKASFNLCMQALETAQEFPMMARNCNLREKILERLRESYHFEEISNLSYDEFSMLYRETGIEALNPEDALLWIAHWVLRPSSHQEEEANSRLQRARVLLEQLHVSRDRNMNASLFLKLSHKKEKILKKSDCYKKFLDFLDQLQQQQRRLWFLPYHQEDSSEVSFVAHDPSTGQSFLIESPQTPENIQVCGTPQLMVPEIKMSRDAPLYCLHAVAQTNKNPCVKTPLLLQYHFSSSMNQRWKLGDSVGTFTYPHNDDSTTPSIKNKGALFLPYKPSLLTDRLPFVRIREQQLSALSSGVGHECNHTPERKIVEVLGLPRSLVTKFSRNQSSNLWRRLVPNLEVTGFGIYRSSDDDDTDDSDEDDDQDGDECGDKSDNVRYVIFGNCFEKDGSKRSITLCGAHCEKKPFPDGVTDAPLSVISNRVGIFVIASCPFITSSKAGEDPEVVQPRLWLYIPRSPELWIPIPTPAFPDTDYASIFTVNRGAFHSVLNLILVQRPKTEATVPSAPTAVPAAIPHEQYLASPFLANSRLSNGRVIGQFELTDRITRLFDSPFNEYVAEVLNNSSVNDLWNSVPVSPQTADFFALGCRLPGRVRITPAKMSTRHLTPVVLRKDEDGRVSVETEVPDTNDELAPAEEDVTPWINFGDSAYRGADDRVIQRELNDFYRSNPALREKMKQRRTEFHFSENQIRAGPHPAIGCKKRETSGDERQKKSDADCNDDQYKCKMLKGRNTDPYR